MNDTMLQQFMSVEDALTSLFGSGVKIAGTERVSGGDINEAYKLALTDGTCIFMKSNKKENASFFTAEASGLATIAQTGAIGTPHVLGGGIDRSIGRSFLLMGFIEGKARIKNYWETFAYELAAIHRTETGIWTVVGIFGFIGNNYIGASSQRNEVYDNWIPFFRECRLEPQFKKAFHYFGAEERKKITKLLEKLENILVEPEHPSLLHGDLWSGNVITGDDGKAWLIDPAVYVGHGEADIAMTELFGGFPQIFYDAYKEAAPMQPGYGQRRDLYNLYHLLNHLNLFGQAYLPSVLGIIGGYRI